MDLRHQALRWFINTGNDDTSCAERALDCGLRPEYLQVYDHSSLSFVHTPEYVLLYEAKQHFDRTGSLPGVGLLNKWIYELVRGGHIDRATASAMSAVINVIPRYSMVQGDVPGVVAALRDEYLRGMAYRGVAELVERELRHGAPEAIGAALRRVAEDIEATDEQGSFYSLADIVEKRWEEYVRREQNEEEGRGIMLGWPDYDRRSNGLRRGEVLVIAANSNVGKSSFQLRSALNAWRLGRCNVLLINQEMTAATQHRRMEAMEMSDILREQGEVRDLLFKIELGKLGENREMYRKLLESYRDNPSQFWVVPPGTYNDLGDIESIIARLRRKHGLDLVCADNANQQRAPGTRAERHDLVLGDTLKFLHDLATRYDVGVITDVQSPPDVEDKREATMYQVVGYSKMIVHHADDLIRLFKLDDRFLEAQVLKSRSGEAGYSFQLYFNPGSMQMEYVSSGVKIG